MQNRSGWQDALTMDDWTRLIGRPDPFIIEVGCNDGTDTRRFLDTFPECRILCFEPDRRAISRFKRMIDDSRCVLIEAAAADRDGWTPWYASHGKVPSNSNCIVDQEARGDWDLSGSIRRPTGHVNLPAWLQFVKEGDVQTVKIDTWIETAGAPWNGQVDLMWWDVQGAEIDVVCGAWRTLPMTRFLFTEFYDAAFHQQGTNARELYAGAPGLAELIGRLWESGQWDLGGFFDGGNVLLKNRRFAP